MAHTVTLIRGDGTGPELAAASQKVLDAALAKTEGAASIEWIVREAGVDIMESAGTPMPEETIESVRNTDATLKAPITTPIGTGFRSVNVLLRQTLDLYACVRPCKSYTGVRSKYEDIDLVVVRENTEDLYAGVEFEKGLPVTAELITEINARATDREIIPIGEGGKVCPDDIPDRGPAELDCDIESLDSNFLKFCN